jgi:PAS domain S-box-containing protein
MQLHEAEKRVVLIVDDEPQVVAALSDALEEDYRVVTAPSPEAALAILKTDKGISVIISDQRMPDMTGDQLLARAQRVSIAARVLITAYADISAVINAVNLGNIFGYISKPWQPHDLALIVRRAADYCELNRRMVHERELLRQLMDSSPDAIAIKDREHRYVRLNDLEVALLQAGSRMEVEGCTAADFLPEERSAARHREEAALFLGGTPIRERIEHVPSDEAERWYSANISPIRDAHGETVGLVSITRDVTDTRRLDAMKDQFIATVRHELRTPLTAIRGALGLLRAGAVNDIGARARKLVEIGYNHSGRLLALINDLLDTEALAKGEIPFDRQPILISAIVADAVEAIERSGQPRPVAIAVAPDMPQVEIDADRKRIRQVLTKLIVNAIEVAPAGGAVRIQAGLVGEDLVRLSVFDQGPGIPASFGREMFQRFSQADSSDARGKSGIGLGLHIAKSIVEAHGGTIGFTNHPAGAEFYVDLPIVMRMRSTRDQRKGTR